MIDYRDIWMAYVVAKGMAGAGGGGGGGSAPVIVSGATPDITAAAGKVYVCEDVVSTLTLTPCDSGVCDVVFESGSTPTVLTVPSSVVWPDWFDPDNLEANRVYELNILDATWGVVTSWAS